jgi:hypothetical protein
MWPAGEKQHVMNKLYGKLRDDPKEFEHAARSQANPNLAAAGGAIPPVGRHTTGDEHFEQVVFSLQPGELSQVVQTGDFLVVARCVRRIPPDPSKKLSDVRPALEKEIFEKKLTLEIPKAFDELKKQANPQFILPKERTQQELERAAEHEIKELSKIPGKMPVVPEAAPKGN